MCRSLIPEGDGAKPAKPHPFLGYAAKPFSFDIYQFGSFDFKMPARAFTRMHKLVDTAQRWGMTGSRVRDDATGLEFSWREI